MKNEQKKFIHDLIAELLGLTGNRCVWANQNMPSLKSPFATLRLYDIAREAQEELRPSGIEGKTCIFVPLTVWLEVQYFGVDAFAKINSLCRLLECPSVVDRTFNARLAFFDATAIHDLTFAIDGQTFEERAAVDLHIRFNSAILDDTGVIDEVDISSQLTNNNVNRDYERKEGDVPLDFEIKEVVING